MIKKGSRAQTTRSSLMIGNDIDRLDSTRCPCYPVTFILFVGWSVRWLILSLLYFTPFFFYPSMRKATGRITFRTIKCEISPSKLSVHNEKVVVTNSSANERGPTVFCTILLFCLCECAHSLWLWLLFTVSFQSTRRVASCCFINCTIPTSQQHPSTREGNKTHNHNHNHKNRHRQSCFSLIADGLLLYGDESSLEDAIVVC